MPNVALTRGRHRDDIVAGSWLLDAHRFDVVLEVGGRAAVAEDAAAGAVDREVEVVDQPLGGRRLGGRVGPRQRHVEALAAEGLPAVGGHFVLRGGAVGVLDDGECVAGRRGAPGGRQR